MERSVQACGSVPGSVWPAVVGEIGRAIGKLHPCRNFLRLIVAAAHGVAAAWGLATIDGLIGSTLEIHIEPGDMKKIGGRKWARIIRRERNKRLRNRCLEPLDMPHIRVRSDATTIVVRMGEKTSLLRGAP